jgi:hypothetical protein
MEGREKKCQGKKKRQTKERVNEVNTYGKMLSGGWRSKNNLGRKYFQLSPSSVLSYFSPPSLGAVQIVLPPNLCLPITFPTSLPLH